MEYRLQFETLSTRIYGLALMNCFLSSLRLDIQREITVLRPYYLTDAIGLAKLVEAKFADTKPTFNRYPKSQTFSPPPHPNTSSFLGPPAATPTFPFRRLSPAEKQDRRSHGLCFNCDDKLSPGHCCKAKQFMILLPEDPNSDTIMPQFTDQEPIDPGPDEPVMDTSSDSKHFHLSHTTLGGPP